MEELCNVNALSWSLLLHPNVNLLTPSIRAAIYS